MVSLSWWSQNGDRLNKHLSWPSDEWTKTVPFIVLAPVVDGNSRCLTKAFFSIIKRTSWTSKGVVKRSTPFLWRSSYNSLVSELTLFCWSSVRQDETFHHFHEALDHSPYKSCWHLVNTVRFLFRNKHKIPTFLSVKTL